MSAIIAACFIFMITSTVVVMKNIGGGKTSRDIAVQQAKTDCDQMGGKLVSLKKDDPLYTACIIGEKKPSYNFV